MIAERMVGELLNGARRLPARTLLEASVRLPPRGRRWIAVYTGATPGQEVWRSTGETDRAAALAKALAWEAEARRRRAALGLGPRKPNLRVQRRPTGASAGNIAPGAGPLSQREVAMILRISERAVRAIERRALEKLRRSPLLRDVWAEHTGKDRLAEPELEGQQESELSPEEVAALFGLVRTEEERRALAKVLASIERS
jgi:hypothetical protein